MIRRHKQNCTLEGAETLGLKHLSLAFWGKLLIYTYKFTAIHTFLE